MRALVVMCTSAGFLAAALDGNLAAVAPVFLQRTMSHTDHGSFKTKDAIYNRTRDEHMQRTWQARQSWRETPSVPLPPLVPLLCPQPCLMPQALCWMKRMPSVRLCS